MVRPSPTAVSPLDMSFSTGPQPLLAEVQLWSERYVVALSPSEGERSCVWGMTLRDSLVEEYSSFAAALPREAPYSIFMSYHWPACRAMVPVAVPRVVAHLSATSWPFT